MKQGQVTQVFIYLASIIIVGVIVLLGYYGIQTIMESGCDVQKQTFKDDLLTFLDQNTRLGNKNTFSRTTPCDIQSLCFVDQAPDNYKNLDQDSGPAPLVADAQAGTGDSIYIEDSNGYQAISDFTGIRVNQQNITCFNTANTPVEISVEGRGRNRVEIQ